MLTTQAARPGGGRKDRLVEGALLPLATKLREALRRGEGSAGRHGRRASIPFCIKLPVEYDRLVGRRGKIIDAGHFVQPFAQATGPQTSRNCRAKANLSWKYCYFKPS